MNGFFVVDFRNACTSAAVFSTMSLAVTVGSCRGTTRPFGEGLGEVRPQVPAGLAATPA